MRVGADSLERPSREQLGGEKDVRLELSDGRTIDALAPAAFHGFLRAVAAPSMIDRDSLVWLRSRLSDAQIGATNPESVVIVAMINLCNAILEKKL
jgi:hypothetical protein